jgi:hypothetical protein
MCPEEAEIRRRLRGRECRAPAEVWTRLEPRLRPKPSSRNLRRVPAIAAFLLMLVSMVVWRTKPVPRPAPAFRFARIRTASPDSIPVIVRPDPDTVLVLLP